MLIRSKVAIEHYNSISDLSKQGYYQGKLNALLTRESIQEQLG